MIRRAGSGETPGSPEVSSIDLLNSLGHFFLSGGGNFDLERAAKIMNELAYRLTGGKYGPPGDDEWEDTKGSLREIMSEGGEGTVYLPDGISRLVFEKSEEGDLVIAVTSHSLDEAKEAFERMTGGEEVFVVK